MRDDKHDPQPAMAARLLSLLDEAYSATDQNSNINEVFREADAFFFVAGAGDLAADLHLDPEMSRRMAGHIDRIQKQLDQAQVDLGSDSNRGPTRHLASLIIDSKTQVVQGNTVATDLLGCAFPTRISALPVSPAALDLLRAAMTDLQQGRFEGSRVIMLDLNDDDAPVVAKAVKLQSFDSTGAPLTALGVTLSHIGWTDSAMDFFVTQYGLTPAEADLLRVLLNGSSQSDAATALGKSRETVKSQAKAILRKSRQTQMADLVAQIHSYAFLAGMERGTRHVVAAKGQTKAVAGGRKVHVARFGLPGGRPILFFHGLAQGPFFSDRMSNAFAAKGIELIAPSRPGFGMTDPPARWDDFDSTVTQDVLRICEDIQGPVPFLVHQAGISFACRAAAALDGRASHAVMVGAGVPIKDYMLRKMNLESRVAAAATTRAPAVLDLLLRLGIAKWRWQGPQAYLENFYGRDAVEIETLRDAEYGPLMEQGILHMIAHGPKPIIHDGMSAMADWEPHFPSLPSQQLWLHGREDPIMHHKFVEEFLAAKGQTAPVIWPGTGADILYARFDDILIQLDKFLAA